MLRERLTWLRLFHLVADALALVVALVCVAAVRGWLGRWWTLDLIPGPPLLQRVAVADQLSLLWVLVPCWLVVLGWRGRYRRVTLGAPADGVWSLLGSSVLALLGTLGLVYLLRVDVFSRTVVAGFALAAVPALAASQRVVRRLAVRAGDALRVRIVGASEHAAGLLASIAKHPEWGVVVVERVDRADRHVADGVDEVVAVGPHATEALAQVAERCEELGVPLSIEASFVGGRIARAEVRELDGAALLTFSTTPDRTAELAAKRVLDLVGAVVGLVVGAPLLASLALLIRLEDGGPVLYVQERVGRYGRRFPMLKLRTMQVGAHDQREALRDQNAVSGPAFKLASDPRITRVGWWLRRTSLDELPQLVNVLRGEMSLVGPRPPLPDEVEQYARWQRRRLSMRPGLTGLWQVTARDDTDVVRWIQLDLQYIDSWSLWGDLGLLVRTVPAVVAGRGAR